MDYPVPDFGVDHDVKQTQASAAGAETSLDTKWKTTKWDDLPKFEEFKLAQKKKGLAQVKSDPQCSSAGCTQFLFPKGPDAHPMDYFVPNFGVDQDILDAQKHEAEADKYLAKRKVLPKDAPEGQETKAVTSMKDQDEKLKKEADANIKEISGEAKLEKTKEAAAKEEKPAGGKAEEKKADAKPEAKADAAAKPEAKPEAKADAAAAAAGPKEVEAAPPAAAAALMIRKSSDPICSSDPTDPACQSPAGLPLEKQVVYPIVPTAKDIETGAHKAGQLQDNTGPVGKWVNAAQKQKNLKSKQNLSIKSEIHMKSDPAFNSDQGYMTNHSSYAIEGAVWHDNTQDKLDPDITDTNTHIGQQEKLHGKWKWTPEWNVAVQTQTDLNLKVQTKKQK